MCHRHSARHYRTQGVESFVSFTQWSVAITERDRDSCKRDNHAQEQHVPAGLSTAVPCAVPTRTVQMGTPIGISGDVAASATRSLELPSSSRRLARRSACLPITRTRPMASTGTAHSERYQFSVAPMSGIVALHGEAAPENSASEHAAARPKLESAKNQQQSRRADLSTPLGPASKSRTMSPRNTTTTTTNRIPVAIFASPRPPPLEPPKNGHFDGSASSLSPPKRKSAARVGCCC